jgi:predicted nucleic acid-binding Zn ribbon protein
MKGVYCPNCGKAHEKNGRFCENCGNDLEEVILRYKRRHLPIKYQQEGPAKGVKPEESSRVYTQGPSDIGPSDIDKPPRRKRTTALSIFSILFLITAAGLAAYVISMDILELWGFVLIGVFGVLFLLTSITSSVLRPRRRGFWYNCCYGCDADCGCSGSECSGCSDCGDCGCGDCGDCGGCDCGGCDC